MEKRLLLGAVIAIAWLCAMVGAIPAYAEAPWWSLTSGSRPTELHPGLAQDEIQSLRVSATGGVLILEASSTKRSVSIPYGAGSALVQAALENEVYGKGNVEVSGGPKNSGGPKPYIYELKFTGELQDQPVELISAENSKLSGGEGTVKATEVAAGDYDGQIIVTAENRGDGEAVGGGHPIILSDKLPTGLRGVAIDATAGETGGQNRGDVACVVNSLTCTFSGNLPPYEEIEVRIGVVVEPAASSSEINEVGVLGGGAAVATLLKRPIHIGASTVFGVENYGLTLEEVGGVPATQAGSHPFQLTTVVTLNQTDAGGGEPAALPKDVRLEWPPGLIGNPTPFGQCTDTEFSKVFDGVNECPEQTAVGVVTATVNEPEGLGGVDTLVVPLFNLKPAVGEPARFGFEVEGSPVTIDTSLRTGGDYGVTVSANNITQTAGFLSSSVTVWGVPGDRRHDDERGWSCVGHGLWQDSQVPPCMALNELRPAPFLVLPTSCTGSLKSKVTTDSWEDRGNYQSVLTNEPLPAMDGCNRLPFNPEISVVPDVLSGSTPTGLSIGVSIPQQATLTATGVAESNLKDTTVVLPEGLTINPGGADGLEACTEAQVGFVGQETGEPATYLFTAGVPIPFCPDASKIGTVEIETPLLPAGRVLRGAVYLGAQAANPFGSLLALYLVAEDPISGSLIKLAGEISLSGDGEVTSTFKNTPQLAFETLRLHFFGGSRAPLSTPPLCGGYTTVASFVPWSGGHVVKDTPSFNIESGPDGSPCANPRPFEPEFQASTTNIQAGSYTPFTTTMSRPDADQPLGGLSMTMPPGLLGTLSSVKLCSEPEASEGKCGPESLIGHTYVSAGLGSNPVTVKRPGEVFITGPYEGAPFGLSIVNTAEAGPFNLGNVVVRAKIEVNPLTAQLTIVSDPLPTMLQGIPLQLQHINVTVDRPGFTFNPTNCAHMEFHGKVTSSEGAGYVVSTPFEVANCAALGFSPTLKVSASGKTSRKDGASLIFRLSYPKTAVGSQANIAKVKVDLPKRLPSRLTTLQKACVAATFVNNPAACPVGSRVGEATAVTPVLPVPLHGPVYFVSYGAAKFPELVVVLSGYGVTVDLHGETFISKASVTSSTFRSVPDVPVDAFEVKLPRGPYSALAANGDLCGSKLDVTVAFTAANGRVIHGTDPISVVECPKAKRVSGAGARRASDERRAPIRKRRAMGSCGRNLPRAAMNCVPKS